MQQDSIVVGGTLIDPAATTWRTPLVARYTVDGAPGSFGTGTGPQTGILCLPFITATSPDADGGSVLDLAPLPDGSYLAAGFVRYDDRPAERRTWRCGGSAPTARRILPSVTGDFSCTTGPTARKPSRRSFSVMTAAS